jgi:Na+/H+ antiporter NhaA
MEGLHEVKVKADEEDRVVSIKLLVTDDAVLIIIVAIQYTRTVALNIVMIANNASNKDS